MDNKAGSSNVGTVLSVRGSVVDIQFNAHLPPIYSLLHANEGKIAIEVLSQLDAHRVRGISLTPTQGLARGMAVEDSGGPLKAPVGKGIISRMFEMPGIGWVKKRGQCGKNRRIMMSETLNLLLPLVTGILLGAIFFGSLWWTIKKVVLSKRSEFWFFAILLLRMSFVLVGFYFIARGSWERLLMCLLGFFITRIIANRLAESTIKPACPAREERHAPQS